MAGTREVADPVPVAAPHPDLRDHGALLVHSQLDTLHSCAPRIPAS